MKKNPNPNLTTFDAFLDQEYGKRGTPKREAYEAGFEEFKLGVLLQQARLAQGLTQEELGAKVGKNKSYISKIENNIKETRLSTLKHIVEVGLGGTVNISITF